MPVPANLGRFGAPPAKLALLLRGQGHGQALHNPDADFHAAQIPPATRIFHRTITDLPG